MIIEDDADLANILALMLQRHNIQSYLALTGEKGIVLGKEMQPDMIILDLGLPDMDGSAVVQALREDNALRLVPLVVYTARELDEQQRDNLRLGDTLIHKEPHSTRPVRRENRPVHEAYSRRQREVQC